MASSDEILSTCALVSALQALLEEYYGAEEPDAKAWQPIKNQIKVLYFQLGKKVEKL